MEAANAVSSVVDLSAVFPETAFRGPIVGDEIVEENSTCNLRDLICKDGLGPSALQRIQKLCRTYGLLVFSKVRSVQVVIKNALVAFASVNGDEVSPADLNESHAAKKSAASFKEKLADTACCLQEFDHFKSTLDDLKANGDEVVAKLKTSEEHVRLLEDKMS